MGIGNNDDVASSGTSERVSLIDPYVEAVMGTNLSPEESIRRSYEQNVRREELIAQCMTETGFQYIPVIPEQAPTPPPPAANVAEVYRPNDRTWVAEYGYAGIRSPWEGIDMGNVIGGGPALITRDPNQDYIDSLTDAERDAYFIALWGPPVEPGDQEGLSQAEMIAQMGCWGWAQHQVAASNPQELMRSEQFAPLFESINQFRQELPFRPEMRELNHDWAVCMEAAGHLGFNYQSDAQQTFWNELTEFWNNWDWNRGEPTLDNSPELAEMHQREIDLALADFDCRLSTNFQARQDEATTAAEQQFINDNRAALESLRAAAEQLG